MVRTARHRTRLTMPISRRMALRTTIAGIGAFTAVAQFGCRRDNPPAATQLEAQPKLGGTLRWHTLLVRSPYDRGLDPHVVPSVDSGLMRLFYQTLVRAD